MRAIATPQDRRALCGLAPALGALARRRRRRARRARCARFGASSAWGCRCSTTSSGVLYPARRAQGRRRSGHGRRDLAWAWLAEDLDAAALSRRCIERCAWPRVAMRRAQADALLEPRALPARRDRACAACARASTTRWTRCARAIGDGPRRRRRCATSSTALERAMFLEAHEHDRTPDARPSSAAASAGWPWRFACRPPASRPRSSRRATSPAAAPTSIASDGFTFDAGPRSSPRRTASKSCSSAPGDACSDYVELLPVTPVLSAALGRRRPLRLRRRRRRDAGADPASAAPTTRAGYLRFVDYAQQGVREGLRRAGGDAVPALLGHGAGRAGARAPARRSLGVRHGRRFVKDEHLRQALSFHSLLVGGNPFETSSIYTLIHYLERNWGVFFPRGGTGALVRALVKLFEELGGELRLSSRRSSASTRARGRRTHACTASTTARRRRGRSIWSCRTPTCTTPTRAARAASRAAARMTRKLERLDWSMSLFVLYFGTDRAYRERRPPHGPVRPALRGLLDDIFHGHALPDDFSLYLHAPTVTDPSLAPPGLRRVLRAVARCRTWATRRSTGTTIAPALRRSHPGRARAAHARSAQARGHAALAHARDFRDELSAYHGSAFCCAPTLTQSAWFRPHNRDPHIPGLYLVGAGTHPGAGVPGVVNSAKATARPDLARTSRYERAARAARRSARAAPVIAHHSKSFALASRLLAAAGARRRGRCSTPTAGAPTTPSTSVTLREQPRALAAAALRARRASTRATRSADPLLAAFQARGARARASRARIRTSCSRAWRWTRAGMRYRHARATLLRYCYRVAGTVGLMMCHVMGVRGSTRARRTPRTSGIAMQLTNIAATCRGLGARPAVPARRAARSGTAPPICSASLGQPLPGTCGACAFRARRTSSSTLSADYYRSGDAGLGHLSLRCGLSVRCARLVYSAIGAELRARGCDPLARARVRERQQEAGAGRAARRCLTLAALPALAQARAHPSRDVLDNPIEALRLVASP